MYVCIEVNIYLFMSVIASYIFVPDSRDLYEQHVV